MSAFGESSVATPTPTLLANPHQDRMDIAYSCASLICEVNGSAHCVKNERIRISYPSCLFSFSRLRIASATVTRLPDSCCILPARLISIACVSWSTLISFSIAIVNYIAQSYLLACVYCVVYVGSHKSLYISRGY